MRIQNIKAGDKFINMSGELFLVSLDTETDLYSLVNITTGQVVITSMDIDCFIVSLNYELELTKYTKQLIWEV